MAQEIPPIRGIQPQRTFANDDELIGEVVTQIIESMRASGVRDIKHMRSPETAEWLKHYEHVPAAELLSEEFLETTIQHILRTQSKPLAKGFALATCAAKLVADEKNQPNVLRVENSFIVRDQNGNEVFDSNNHAVDSYFSNDAIHNKARIAAGGGVGMLVKFWKIEPMKKWGDFRDGTFVSTGGGPVLYKCYTGVISAVGKETVDINPLETLNNRGYKGVPSDRIQCYVPTANKGADYPSAMGKDPAQENTRFFTKGCQSKDSGLLNLDRVVVRYDQMLAPAKGRLTSESLVRFIDTMDRVNLLRRGGEITCISKEEAAEYRKHGQPKPRQYYQYVNGKVEVKVSRDERSDSQTTNQELRLHADQGQDEFRDQRTLLGCEHQARQRQERNRQEERTRQRQEDRQLPHNTRVIVPSTRETDPEPRGTAFPKQELFPHLQSNYDINDCPRFGNNASGFDPGLAPYAMSQSRGEVPSLDPRNTGYTRATENTVNMRNTYERPEFGNNGSGFDPGPTPYAISQSRGARGDVPSSNPFNRGHTRVDQNTSFMHTTRDRPRCGNNAIGFNPGPASQASSQSRRDVPGLGSHRSGHTHAGENNRALQTMTAGLQEAHVNEKKRKKRHSDRGDKPPKRGAGSSRRS